MLDLLKTRQTKYGAYVAAYTVIIIGVLGAGNWLAQRYNKSLDTTSNKKFSLSDQTEKVVKGLKQDVVIQYFDRTSNFAQAKDLLDRYDNLSTKLAVEYIDPDKKPQLARLAGVKNYGTTYINIGAKREEVRSVTEEEVTGALIRALKGGERLVCSVKGSGEHSFEDNGRDGYSGLKETLERNNYKTRSISLLEKAEVPKECTILLVAGPRYDYPQTVVDAIKTYVTGGGHALIAVDPPLTLGKESIAENQALVTLLEGWGVAPQKNLVIDLSPVGQIFGFSAAVPLVTSYESHPIVRDMKDTATAFPMVRSVDPRTGENATAAKLFSSSENSFATANLSSAEVKLNPDKDKKGPFVLGAAGTTAAPPGTPDKEKATGRFVVVGSSSFMANSILRFNGNRDLTLNMMNWLSQDEDLISIRPKEPQDRRLSLTRSQMSMILYSSVIGLPLLVIAAGLRVWWNRR